VVGTDIDPDALACAAAHADLDGLAHPIHFTTDSPDTLGERFDLVVANILESPLHELVPALRAALRSGGRLLLSGITRPQIPALRVACEKAGLDSQGDAHRDGWAIISFGRA
jgi:ribosomal protein L11 methyltransferase